MLNKEDIYVIVDTPKKEKKLRKVLKFFGENVSHYPDHRNRLHNGNSIIYRYGFSNGSWQGVNTKFVGHKGEVFTEVSIKELRNILTYHHQVTQLNIGYEAGKGYHRENELWPKTSSDINFELTPDDYKNNTWYKSNTGNIFFLEKGKKNYGFGTNPDEFMDNIEWFSNFRENGFHIKGQWTEATEQEVLEAFTKEANKRFKVGDRIYYITCDEGKSDPIPSMDTLIYEDNSLQVKIFRSHYYYLFKGGKWATVVDCFDELKKAYKNGAVIECKGEKPKVGDLCKLWDDKEGEFVIAYINDIDENNNYPYMDKLGSYYKKAKIINKEEVIDLLFKN